MTEHLSTEQLDRYRKKLLSPADLLGIDQHVTTCSPCRERLQAMGSPPQLFRERSALQDIWSEHLTYEQMAAYVDTRMDDIERDIVESHEELCERCASELRHLKGFAEKLAALPGPKPSLWTRLAAWWQIPQYRLAGALAMAIGLTFLFALSLLRGKDEFRSDPIVARHQTAPDSRISPGNEDTATSKTKPGPDDLPRSQPPDAPFRIAEHGHTPEDKATSGTAHPYALTRHAEERFASTELALLPAAYQEIVQAAMRTEHLEVPAPLRSLRKAQEALSHEERTRADFALRSPLGKVVAEDQPLFVWEAIGESATYTVSVFDASRAEVLTSEPVADTSWTARRSLLRDTAYSWRVTARQDGQEFLSPTAYFHVLASEDATQLVQIRAQYPDAHLLLSVLYLWDGLLDDAAREIEKLRMTSPVSPEAEKLWKDLQRLRQAQE